MLFYITCCFVKCSFVTCSFLVFISVTKWGKLLSLSDLILSDPFLHNLRESGWMFGLTDGNRLFRHMRKSRSTLLRNCLLRHGPAAAPAASMTKAAERHGRKVPSPPPIQAKGNSNISIAADVTTLLLNFHSYCIVCSFNLIWYFAEFVLGLFLDSEIIFVWSWYLFQL